MKKIVLSGAACTGVSQAVSQMQPILQKTKNVKILCVADIHFNGNSKPHYPKTEYALPIFFDMLKERISDFDMMIIVGDCVNAGSANIEELVLLKKKLDSFGIEYHLVAGNHDIAPSKKYADWYPGMEDIEDCRLEETNFAKVFGLKSIREVVDLEYVQLVMFSIRDNDEDGQLKWLRKVLSNKKRSLVFCHYPVLESREGGFCSNWGYSRIGNIRQELTEVLTSENSNVSAYFCGHQHINSRVEIDGLHQVVTGALGLQTCCYKEIEIDDSGINVKTIKLSAVPDWLQDAMQKDCSLDENHKTVMSYHWGNDDERNFEL